MGSLEAFGWRVQVMSCRLRRMATWIACPMDRRTWMVAVFLAGGAPLIGPHIVGNWTPTGALRFGRALQSATLLRDGEVLVVGGEGDSIDSGGAFPPLASAEIYAPRQGRWRATAAMAHPREEHMAVLLPDGRVLVVGGRAGLDATTLASAEIYDPRRAAWARAGSMQDARYAAAVASLPNGEVLIAGGEGKGLGPLSHPLRGAELYDPRRGIWRRTGAMHVARVDAAAAILPDGRVLVMGGDDNYEHVVATAEVYDPRRGTWTLTTPMHGARAQAEATTLVDGRVLVAGGVTFAGPADGRPYAIPADGCEIYDPRRATWTRTGSLLNARFGHGQVRLRNGRVLVAGGGGFVDGETTTLDDAEVYDPVRGTWVYAGRTSTHRSGQTATLLADGRVMVVGGLLNEYFNGSPLRNVDIFTP